MIYQDRMAHKLNYKEAFNTSITIYVLKCQWYYIDICTPRKKKHGNFCPKRPLSSTWLSPWHCCSTTQPDSSWQANFTLKRVSNVVFKIMPHDCFHSYKNLEILKQRTASTANTNHSVISRKGPKSLTWVLTAEQRRKLDHSTWSGISHHANLSL